MSVSLPALLTLSRHVAAQFRHQLRDQLRNQLRHPLHPQMRHQLRQQMRLSRRAVCCSAPLLLLLSLTLPAQAMQTASSAASESSAQVSSTQISSASANSTAPVIWIDVRSKEEFDTGHLPGAINIPHHEIAARISEVTQDKNATIALYCRSGRRSGLAEQALQQLGFTQVSNAGAYETLKASQPAKP